MIKKFFLSILALIPMFTTTIQAQEYVEVCGIKWAKGNLQYDEINGGAENFQTNWKLSDHQWEYFYHNPTSYFNFKDKSTWATLYFEQRDHFNWGVIGDSALYKDKYSRAPKLKENYDKLDIGGKLYSDDCVTEYNKKDKFTNTNIHYGDLPYWASKGRYKLPGKAEIDSLLLRASYQYGYYLIEEGDSVFGAYFYNPEGARETNFQTPREITDEDMEKGLFLPYAGHRMTNLNFEGEKGYYAASGIYKQMEYIIILGEVSMLYMDKTYFDWNAWTPGFGFSMRPVINYKLGDVNEDGSVNITDIVSMINYLTESSDDFINPAAGDMNNSGSVDMADLIALIARITI